MKKVFIILLLFLNFFYSVAQDKFIEIQRNKYTILTKEDENESGSEPYREIEIYKDNEKLLTHTINDVWGDSNSISVELGTYEIKNNKLILYNYWAWAGDAPVSPYGVRKQIYSVSSEGLLKLEKGDIYLEVIREGWETDVPEEYKAVKYLFKDKLTTEETKFLNAYKDRVKTEYHSTNFVEGQEKKQLFKEVKSKLKKEINKETHYWETIPFGFGYKK